MSRSIDYYFTPQSPWTYLGHARFAALAKSSRRHGASAADRFRRRLPGVGRPSARKARAAAAGLSAGRSGALLAAPGHAAEHQAEVLPGVASDDAARLIIAVDQHDGTDAAMKLCGAVFAAVWVQERNIADPKVLEALLVECGLSARRHRAVAKPGRAGALRGLHAAGDRRRACSARRAT